MTTLFKYSIWELIHESIYTVRAHKIKNTNSIKEIEIHLAKSPDNVASFYREENELNATHLQIFTNF